MCDYFPLLWDPKVNDGKVCKYVTAILRDTSIKQTAIAVCELTIAREAYSGG